MRIFIFQWFSLVRKVTEYDKSSLRLGKRYRADLRTPLGLCMICALLLCKYFYLRKPEDAFWITRFNLYTFVLVPYYINVEISNYVAGKTISLKGESIFEPVINIIVTSAPKQRSKLTLQIYYERNSLLFQVLVKIIKLLFYAYKIISFFCRLQILISIIFIFQYIVAPVLSFLMRQHFQHGLFNLRWLMPPP